MLDSLGKNLLRLLLLLWGITLVGFFVVHLAPGSTVESIAGFDPVYGTQARARLTALYGLDQPLAERYFQWALKMAQFDFGESFVDGELVLVKIGRAIPVTLVLNGLALALSLFLGIPLGVWMAANRGKKRERAADLTSLALYSMPSFWVALALMSFLGVGLHLFPVTGLRSYFHDEMSFFARVWDIALHLVVPVIVMALPGLAFFSRYVKESMEDALKQNYILTARARGLSEKSILYRHALKNALLPVVTLLGLMVPALLGGSVVLESLFAIPGMGRLFLNSVFSRDYPVIMGVLTLSAILTLLGNTAADLAYRYVDPRIRAGRAKH